MYSVVILSPNPAETAAKISSRLKNVKPYMSGGFLFVTAHGSDMDEVWDDVQDTLDDLETGAEVVEVGEA